jgi:hypothetical protein
MPDPAGAGPVTWLVLVYQLPAKTSALRAMVHRKLSAADAVYLSRACAAAPAGPAERVMRRMRAMITDVGGSAALLRAQALVGEPDLTAAFNAARDREYDGIITGCRDAVTAVETMAAAGDFRYEQLREHDAGLKRLNARCRAMREHDMLGASKAPEAASALAGYRTCPRQLRPRRLRRGQLMTRAVSWRGQRPPFRWSPVPARQ